MIIRAFRGKKVKERDNVACHRILTNKWELSSTFLCLKIVKVVLQTLA